MAEDDDSEFAEDYDSDLEDIDQTELVEMESEEGSEHRRFRRGRFSCYKKRYRYRLCRDILQRYKIYVS